MKYEFFYLLLVNYFYKNEHDVVELALAGVGSERKKMRIISESKVSNFSRG